MSAFFGLLLLCLLSFAAGNCFLSVQNYVCAETLTLNAPKTSSQKAVINLRWSGTIGTNDTVTISWGSDFSKKLKLNPVYNGYDYLITDFYGAGTNNFHYELTSSAPSSSITITTGYVWSYY